MMEKYNIEETMAFTGHRLIEPGRVEDIKAQLRIKIKACSRGSPIFEG